MRVLMIIAQYPPLIGGAELQAARLSTSLAAVGVQVEVLTGWVRGTARREVLDGVVVNRLPAPGLGSSTLKTLMLAMQIYRAVLARRNQFDVAHIHIASPLAWAAMRAAHRMGRPCLIKIANSGSRFDLDALARRFVFGLGRRMAHDLARRADRFVALTPVIVDDLARWGVAADRTVSIPNGVQMREPIDMAHRGDARLRLHIGLNEAVIVCVASLQAKKNHVVLLRALKHLAECGINARLMLLGDGPLRPELEQQVRELGLQSQVDMRGRIENVADYLYAADGFVLPSLAEGLSNALLEAMSVGLPCVASDIPGNRALIVDGTTGLLCEPTNAAGLADALSRVLREPDAVARWGTAARHTVIERYSLAAVTQQYQNLYSTLIT